MSFVIALIMYVYVLLDVGYYNNCNRNPNCPDEPYFMCEIDLMESQCHEILFELYDDEFKNFVINRLNTYRDTTANGSIPTLPPADRMVKMSWDNELADAAMENVRLCLLEKVKCANTVKFKHVGQNKGKVTVPDDVGFDVDSNIFVGEILDSWFYEWKEGKTYYNLPNIIHANGTRVGCAGLVELSSEFTLVVHVVCHFACGFIPNMAVYHGGDPASECLTGADHEFPALCSENEIVDPNFQMLVDANGLNDL